MKWTVPVESSCTAMSPSPVETMALLARTCPGRKLMVLVLGSGVAPAYRRRSPGAVGPTTVTLTDRARAVAGMPQLLLNVGKTRPLLAASTGPPSGLVALRVSAMRHGARVKKRSGTGGAATL